MTPDRPFYVFVPKNEAPVFISDLPTEEQEFNVGEAWEFELPEITDLEKD